MYAELNTKSDYCEKCGYDGEIKIVEDEAGKLVWECPNCGNRDQNKLFVATPYLRLHRNPVLESGTYPGDPRSGAASVGCGESLREYIGLGEEDMYYGTIKKYDIANGPGVRVSLFVSGCRHHCKGCFNAETWDFRYGQLYTEETEKEILAALEPGYIQGFTLLGGEPFEPENQMSGTFTPEGARDVSGEGYLVL